jgi:2-polyprenyl-3-methyl-5-hydroxy-6-metoxy-1,4-benzoquinol methylase
VLGQDYLTSIPELDAILSRPHARVADLGCGGGWSSIAIARAYPGTSVDGYDLDAPSIEQATNAADSAGLSTRVQFFALDAATLSEATARCDLVTIFEAIHDVPTRRGPAVSAENVARGGAWFS